MSNPRDTLQVVRRHGYVATAHCCHFDNALSERLIGAELLEMWESKASRTLARQTVYAMARNLACQ